MPALTLFIAAVFYRIFAGYCGAENSWLLNFSPVAAIALCGPVIFPRRVALVLPLAILLASDMVERPFRRGAGHRGNGGALRGAGAKCLCRSNPFRFWDNAKSLPSFLSPIYANIFLNAIAPLRLPGHQYSSSI